MTTQTEAERLADLVERHPSDDVELVRAAAELRRLVSFNQQLMDEVARLQKREWVGLTPDDIRQLEKENTVGGYNGDYCPTWDLIEAVEAFLREKNT